jgi:MSHA biogenesis protein MshL
VANAGTSNSGNQSNGSSNNNSNNNGGNERPEQPERPHAIAARFGQRFHPFGKRFLAGAETALEALVETGKDGRSVTISPQSGVIVIRAMPDELRNVDMYLKATQLG